MVNLLDGRNRPSESEPSPHHQLAFTEESGKPDKESSKACSLSTCLFHCENLSCSASSDGLL